MNDKQLQEKFSEILVEQLGVHLSLANDPASRFVEDLQCDSLDGVELVMACEEEFMISIPDGEFDDVKTVAQALAFLKSKMVDVWEPKK